MKPISPIFTHSQYPAQLFFLPPGWAIALLLSFLLVLFGLHKVWPNMSLIISILFLAISFIVMKIKLGRDRHSDRVFSMGLEWRRRHWRGKISAGERS